MENQVPPDFQMPQCAAVPDSERIDNCRRDINHIYGALEKLETTHFFGEERLRQDRWHATFNAALQSYSLYELGESEMSRRCTAFADLRHGPLKPADEA